MLALETINRLSIKYRLENSCYLLCNAWELLLKAKIIADTGKNNSIYHKTKRGEQRRTLALRDCVKIIFENERDTTRRNIEMLADLRDAATHFVISNFPKEILGIFQASVINLHAKSKEWFNVSISDRVPIGMMAIVYDFHPQHTDLSSQKLRRELGRDAVAFLSKYCANVSKEYIEFGMSPEYYIGIQYKLALTKNVEGSDIVLTKGHDSELAAHIIENPRDPAKAHPHRLSDIKANVNKELIFDYEINMHDLKCILSVCKIHNRPDFFYRGAVIGSPSQYSTAFSDWIVKQYTRDNTFFTKTRAKYKDSRNALRQNHANK